MAGTGLQMSLPAGLPRWVLSRPFLLAGIIRWLNLHQRHRALLPAAVVLLLGSAVVLTRPEVGRSFEVAAAFPFAPFVVLTATFAVSTMRRKAYVYQSLIDSWLAPVAAPTATVLRISFLPLLQLVLELLAVAIALVAGSLSRPGAVTLAATAGAAFVAGSLVGWLSGSDRGGAEPDFHHVTVRSARAGWAQNPRLEPLSYWAIAQARVFAKPKVMARATFFVLMLIPLGTPGQKAIAIAAGIWVLFYLSCLIVAAVRVAFNAAWWLAPTTVGYRQFTRMLCYRVLLAQVWTWAWVVFLTYATGLPGALRVGLGLAVLCLLVSGVVIVGACRVAMKSVGMRPL